MVRGEWSSMLCIVAGSLVRGALAVGVRPFWFRFGRRMEKACGDYNRRLGAADIQERSDSFRNQAMSR